MFSKPVRTACAGALMALSGCSAERPADGSVTKAEPILTVPSEAPAASLGTDPGSLAPKGSAKPPESRESAKPRRERTSRVDTLPYYDGPSFEPHWLSPSAPELKSFHSIGPFHLVNQQGEPVTQKTFENKIYVTDFFFTTCPGICLKLTENMRRIQDAFADDKEVMLLSHSVSPDTDTPAVLAQYGRLHGVKPGKWHLVTGSEDSIYDLGRKQYFIEEDLGVKKSNDDFLHTENLLIIDGQQHIRGIYNGLNKTEVSQLIADVRTLKLEG